MRLSKWRRVVAAVLAVLLFNSSLIVVNAGQTDTEDFAAKAGMTEEVNEPLENETVETEKMEETEETQDDESDEQAASDIVENVDGVLDEETDDRQQEPAASEENLAVDQQSEATGPVISYKAHVSEIGWQQKVENGEMAGTVGQNLPMEALTVNLEWNSVDEEASGVEYGAHVSDMGWQTAVKNGEIAGTTGCAKAIEAIRIRLTGPIAEQYDIYYRVHSAIYGWFDWAKNGETAGSIGFAYAMQGLEIRIYSKNSPDKPVTTGKTYLAEDNMGAVIYQAHMQDKGWEPRKVDGQEAGSSTENKNVEAIRIQVSESARQYGKLVGSIEYETHVRDIGWQNKVADGEQAGTSGQNKPIEAIKISLTDQLADTYDVYYRVYIQNRGWLGWAKNGELAGSVGFAYSVKAFEIQLYTKDNPDKPVSSNDSYLTEENMGKIIYQSHIQTIGWQKKVTDGEVTGTTGRALGIEALSVIVSASGRENNTLSGSVIYQAHVSGVGWQDEVSDGETAGTTGQDRRIEAVRIRLTEQLEARYDVYYRVHATNFGWLEWAKNGETAGSTGYGSPIEAIQIQLYEKGSADVPKGTGRTFLSREQISSIDIQEHLENMGWQTAKNGTQLTAGTTGQNRSIEAIAMAVKPSGSTYTGGITYNAHVQDIGWQGWHSDGNVAGTVGQAKKIAVGLDGQRTENPQVHPDIHTNCRQYRFG